MSSRKKISHAREFVREKPWLSKASVAREFGVSRAALYRTPALQAMKDKALLAEVLRVLREHRHYGHRRIALVLGRNKNTILRIMRKYALRPRKRRARGRGLQNQGKPASGIPNRIKGISPSYPNLIWAGDFTELSFYGFKIYVATVIDLYTREIAGWDVGYHHSAELVVKALDHATRRRSAAPHIFHSDQGSEYDSLRCRAWLMAHRVLPSMSAKAHPWENGRQESFYRRFKEELGRIHDFASVEDLVAAIHHQIHYYNEERIHSVLKMPPSEFCSRAVAKLPPPVRRPPKWLSTSVYEN